MGIPRDAQDEFAISSYKKSQAAAAAGIFQKEITPVTIKQRKGNKYLSYYRPRSKGDNTFGQVRLSVCLVVGALLFEPFDL